MRSSCVWTAGFQAAENQDCATRVQCQVAAGKVRTGMSAPKLVLAVHYIHNSSQVNNRTAESMASSFHPCSTIRGCTCLYTRPLFWHHQVCATFLSDTTRLIPVGLGFDCSLSSSIFMALQATQLSKQQAEQSRKAAQDAETASTHLQGSMQLQAAKQLEAQAEQASQRAAEQQHKLQTTQAQVQELQTLVQSQQDQLKGAEDQQSRDLQQAQAQAKQTLGQLQAVNQQVSDLQTSQAAAEASQRAELTQLRDELEAAHQQLQTQEVSLRWVSCTAAWACLAPPPPPPARPTSPTQPLDHLRSG